MNDEPDRHGHDIGVALHIFRQRHLIAVFDFLAQDRRHLGDAAGRAVDDIDALGFEYFCQPRALLRSPAGIVFDRQADEQRFVIGPVRPHRFGDLGDEPHPV